MITYNYLKPIEEINAEDQNFTLVFTDGSATHMDSVVIPRYPDTTVNTEQLLILITDLVNYVNNKFGDNF